MKASLDGPPSTGPFDAYHRHSPVLKRLVELVNLFFIISFSLILNNCSVDKSNRNRLEESWVEQRPRPRRNRKSESIRALVRENIVTPKYDSPLPPSYLLLLALM